MTHPARLVAALALLLACGCKGVCDTGVLPGVVVEIRDDQTNASIADSAAGLVIDGAYADSLRPYALDSGGVMLSRFAAEEREGTYLILLTRPGYATWSASGVRVTDGECHVRTAVVQARMTHSP